MNLEEFGFDEHGQLIDGWVNPNQCAPAPRHRFWRDRRGFGHWVAQAMGVGAMFVLFNYLWPAAQTMMQSTVQNMTILQNRMQGTLNGLTVTGTGSAVTITFPSGTTPMATSSDYTVTVNGTADAISGVTVSGQVATLTLTTTMNSGSAIVVDYTDGTETYPGSGTAA